MKYYKKLCLDYYKIKIVLFFSIMKIRNKNNNEFFLKNIINNIMMINDDGH